MNWPIIRDIPNTPSTLGICLLSRASGYASNQKTPSLADVTKSSARQGSVGNCWPVGTGASYSHTGGETGHRGPASIGLL